jgi:hypothetical protein
VSNLIAPLSTFNACRCVPSNVFSGEQWRRKSESMKIIAALAFIFSFFHFFSFYNHILRKAALGQ